MPELPEVETVRRGLLLSLPGRRIQRVEVLREASVGFPDAESFAEKLVGHKFKDISRRGKYLVFELDKGAYLGAHLRMSGRLLVSDKAKAGAAGREMKVSEKHVRVKMDLDDGSTFVFEDMRVFGRLWYVPKGARPEDIISGLRDLGVEPGELLTAGYLKEHFAKKSQAIKTALLDQTVIAGIGNIYADESLHKAHINPHTPARELTPTQLKKLTACIKEVLDRAIEARGSSLRNYTDSSGVNGNYQSKALVYGREASPCHGCKREIVRVKINGRSSHFCPKCQPKQ